MAKCDVCGKGVAFGKKFSHSNIRTNRRWKHNVQRIKVDFNGENKRIYVCTRCLRSAKLAQA